MFKSSAGYEHDWYVIKSSEKPFTGFDHVTNQVHILGNFLNCWGFFLNKAGRNASQRNVM